METHTDTNTTRKTYADKLCLAAIISCFIGISSFFLCLVLDRFIPPHWRNLEDVLVTGIWLGIGLICFIVPFLALSAIIDILTNWRVVTNPDDDKRSQGLLHKTARNLFITPCGDS